MAGELTSYWLARGRGVVSGEGGSPAYQFVNPEAAALVLRFTTEPDDARKALIDGRFTAGKALSFWAKLDALWVHAAHGAEAARLNWMGDYYNCIPVNNPVFTADRGYMGDGSSSYLDTQFNPRTATSPKFQQNSGCLGVRSNTDNASTGSLAGFFTGSSDGCTTINPRTSATTNFAQMRATSGASLSTANQTSTSAIGMFATNRTDASNISAFREGVKVGTTAAVSLLPPTGNFRLGSISNASYRACQFSMGWVSGGLTDQEIIDLFNWFEPYRTAVGVI